MIFEDPSYKFLGAHHGQVRAMGVNDGLVKMSLGCTECVDAVSNFRFDDPVQVAAMVAALSHLAPMAWGSEYVSAMGLVILERSRLYG